MKKMNCKVQSSGATSEMKSPYLKPDIRVIRMEMESMICVSGKIGDWKLDNDTSDGDDWSDSENPNNAKVQNPWNN